MKYLLFIFAKNDNQEKFMKVMAEEVAILSDSNNIKYYFGPESAIMAFETEQKFEEVRYIFEMVIGSTGIVYFLTQFEPDKMSYWLEKSVEQYLFGTKNDDDERSEKSLEEQISVQKFLFGNLENEINNEFAEIDDEFDDVSEIQKIKSKPRKMTLNEILDKINEKGYQSLTKKELSLLEEYSKN